MNEKGGKDSRITALYVRVSTGYQIDKDSLPFQKKELKNYCVHVLHLSPDELEVYEDAGKSGKNTDRPAFQRRGLSSTKSTVFPETLLIFPKCTTILKTTGRRLYL